MIALWNEFPSTRMKMLSFQLPALPQPAPVLQSRWAGPGCRESIVLDVENSPKEGEPPKQWLWKIMLILLLGHFWFFFDSIFSFRVSRLREYAYVHTTWRSCRHPWGYDQEIWGIQPTSLLLL